MPIAVRDVAQSRIRLLQILLAQLSSAGRSRCTRYRRAQRVRPVSWLHDEGERVVVVLFLVVDAFPA
jgi:hypothetical protein